MLDVKTEDVVRLTWKFCSQRKCGLLYPADSLTDFSFVVRTRPTSITRAQKSEGPRMLANQELGPSKDCGSAKRCASLVQQPREELHQATLGLLK